MVVRRAVLTILCHGRGVHRSLANADDRLGADNCVIDRLRVHRTCWSAISVLRARQAYVTYNLALLFLGVIKGERS